MNKSFIKMEQIKPQKKRAFSKDRYSQAADFERTF